MKVADYVPAKIGVQEKTEKGIGKMIRIYSYYITQRPPSPGAMPKHGFIRAVYLDQDEKRVYVPEINRMAYARLEYQRELTEKEISDYELIPRRD